MEPPKPPQTERKKRKDAKHRSPLASNSRADGSRKNDGGEDLAHWQIEQIARDDTPFIASKRYKGRFPGYYFGTTIDELGTGYYLDTNKLEEVVTEEPTEETAEAVAPAPAPASTEVALAVPAPDAALAAATPTGAALAALAALAVDAALAGDAAAAAASAEEVRELLRSRHEERVATGIASGRTESAANNVAEVSQNGDVAKVARELRTDKQGTKIGLKYSAGSSQSIKAPAQKRWFFGQVNAGKLTAKAIAKVLGTNYLGRSGRHGGMKAVLVASYWSGAAGELQGPLKPERWLLLASAAQLGRFEGVAISGELAGRYLNAPFGGDYDGVNLVAMRAFALCFAVDGDESRADVQVVPLDWNARTTTTPYERVLRESAGRIADERARAAETARLERGLARERNLAARQNCVTVVEHPPTLVNRGDAADLEAQRRATVEASRGFIPPDFLKFLPLQPE